MNYKALSSNLIDVIKESQLKLGYEETSISLYYPIEALNNLLDSNLHTMGMEKALKTFALQPEVKNTLGNITFSQNKSRFCISIPVKGVSYVHENIKDTGFLEAFLKCISDCHCTIDDILNVFHKFSDSVKYEKMNSDEFDYVVYFETGKPDAYRYCIHFEMGHTIYHRFNIKEYQEIIK